MEERSASGFDAALRLKETATRNFWLAQESRVTASADQARSRTDSRGEGSCSKLPGRLTPRQRRPCRHSADGRA